MSVTSSSMALPTLWLVPKKVITSSAIAPSGKKSGCRTTSSDTAVQTGPDTVRYPDVVVDCGPPDPSAKTASRPTFIVEVTSPGTSFVDYGDKLREYQRLESVDTVMQIESEFVLVKVHRRQSDGTWTDETVEDFGVAIPIPSIGASITLDEVYDTLDLRPRPRLVVVTKAVTSSSENPIADDPLLAYSQGQLSRSEAIRILGMRDYAELLVALGDADLPMPLAPPHEIENQATTFTKLWRQS